MNDAVALQTFISENICTRLQLVLSRVTHTKFRLANSAKTFLNSLKNILHHFLNAQKYNLWYLALPLKHTLQTACPACLSHDLILEQHAAKALLKYRLDKVLAFNGLFGIPCNLGACKKFRWVDPNAHKQSYFWLGFSLHGIVQPLFKTPVPVRWAKRGKVTHTHNTGRLFY